MILIFKRTMWQMWEHFTLSNELQYDSIVGLMFMPKGIKRHFKKFQK